MKLIIEKHPELTRLMNFFAEVEGMAERLGLNIDELNPDRKENISPMQTHFRKNAGAISAYRSEILNASSKKTDKSSGCCSIASLSIHK